MKHRAVGMFLFIVFATGISMPVVAQYSKHKHKSAKKKQTVARKTEKDTAEIARQKKKMVKDILKEKMNR